MSDRHTFRAKWHDYNGGIYFVTICSADKRHIFGYISDARMHLSPIGKIVDECLSSIPVHNSGVEIWNQIVMPNHIHMVVMIPSQPVGAQYIAPEPGRPVGAQYIAPGPGRPEPKSNIGCLKPPRYGEPCNDNHHNSALAVIVRTFKAAVTRIVKSTLAQCQAGTTRAQCQAGTTRAQCQAGTTRAQCIAPLPVWQRNYHEHIIRNQRAFDNIMEYINTNPERWLKDCFNEETKGLQ